MLIEAAPTRSEVWTSASTRELIDRFIDAPDVGDRSFIDKLRDQLNGATAGASQLLTELTWFHYLISSSVTGDTKRRNLSEIADIGGAALPEAELSAALNKGPCSTGVAFNMHRPNHLSLLIRFADAWLSMSPDENSRLLAEPWAFRSLVFDLDGMADQAQRHALLHLIHPDTFEDSTSQNHKSAMVRSLAEPDEISESDDHTIARVRERLSETYGDHFSFYGPDIRPLWLPETAAMSGQEIQEEDDLVDNPDRQAWLVRGSGGERVPEWLEQGTCAIYYEDSFPFPIESGVGRDELREMSEEAGVDITAGGYSNELGQVWRFVNKIEIGDYVITVAGQDIYLGIVESETRTIGGRGRRQTVRTVDWLNPQQPVRRSAVAPAVYSKLKTLLTLSNITSVMGHLERWADGQLPGEEPEEGVTADVVLEPAGSALHRRSLLPEAWLDEVIALLSEKKQVVLYGPPGTGKTYLAQILADHLTTDGGSVELVQFHPSYAYEDFFEGYRPVPAAGGTVAFEIKPGPLRRIAQVAREEPRVPHILIIDEINRANLAKVFGELYFLLEYRDRVITLQYSDEEFTLPENLYVIGTMNTADRSIALVDSAMRRRFYFVEMAPGVEPVSDLLSDWLRSHQIDDLPARMLDELNRRIGDPDAAIGPSYMMSKEITQKGRLERVWQHAIMPLLRERFYGVDGDLSRFSYDAIRGAVEQNPTG